MTGYHAQAHLSNLSQPVVRESHRRIAHLSDLPTTSAAATKAATSAAKVATAAAKASGELFCSVAHARCAGWQRPIDRLIDHRVYY
jgi:hypothetical protein